jgi:hypothetical protein
LGGAAVDDFQFPETGNTLFHIFTRIQKQIEGLMLNLAGGTVQCLNPECIARGRWLRLHDAPQESCNNCGAPLHSVPPPLPPRFRMRARPMRSYRPMGRGR